MTAAGLDLPWARSRPATLVREGILRGFFGPAMSTWTSRSCAGLEHLDALEGPAVFVANHASHMDTPLLLRSLPRPYRGRTAVAAAADYFYVKRRAAFSVALLFNTVGVERRGAGLDDEANARLAALFAGGHSLLLYPEGTRAKTSVVARLRSGAAVIAAQHGLPVVPIHVAGTATAMPRGKHWMVRKPGGGRHPITVTFGPPVLPGEGLHRSEVMERVREHLAACGSDTTPPRAKQPEAQPEAAPPVAPAAS